MRKALPFFAALCAFTAIAVPAHAGDQRRVGGGTPDRLEAARSVRQGDILPLNVIRDRISARMPGANLIGADLVGGTVYRLRFMRGANVILVDVDARTGNPIRCIGC